MRSRILKILLIGFLLASTVLPGYAVNTSGCVAKMFKITAYYSAKPTQSFFFQDSYEDEIALNGKGTHGASGKPVFNGMIAAPKSYEFGTMIYFPDRGVGEVADRGGAIVEEGENNEPHDRLDLRLGSGEEGLQRALSFGVQYVKGYICPQGTDLPELGFDYDAFPSYDNFFEQTLWIMTLNPGRRDAWVLTLQKILVSLGYLDKSSLTGFFGKKTKAAVCVFQQKTLGISEKSEWCGYFGPQTRIALREHMKTIAAKPIETDTKPAGAAKETVEEKAPVPDANDPVLNTHLFTEGEFVTYEFTKPFTKGYKHHEVRIAQRKLAMLGYYPVQRPITGIYDETTLEAVYAFQLKNNLIQENDPVPLKGYFGPATRRKLTSCSALCVLPTSAAIAFLYK